MQALVYNGERLRYTTDYARPIPKHGEALLRIRLAGICSTDLEIIRGYKGWQGVLGHEFVAEVADVGSAADRHWIGRRVVGEINVGCGACHLCEQGDPRHCATRSALGIFGRDGAFADYCLLPVANLHPVPEAVPDEVAVFTEPLAAALEIAEQLHVRPSTSVCVVGDGRLGCLIAQTLRLTGAAVAMAGRHPDRLEHLHRLGVEPVVPSARYPLVIDCTGSSTGLATARALVAPRGQIVLKSTYQGATEADLSSLVVDEVTLVGSRCGPFAPALRLLALGLVDVTWMVEAEYPLSRAVEAFEGARGRLKTLLRVH